VAANRRIKLVAANRRIKLAVAANIPWNSNYSYTIVLAAGCIYPELLLWHKNLSLVIGGPG